MKPIVELVSAWTAFEDLYPKGTIEDFCRQHLALKTEKKQAEPLFDGEMPPRPDIILTKMLDRFARLHRVYIQLAMKGLKLKHFEEFNLLSAISNLKNPRKTDVIYHTLIELSTGLNLLSALRKRGYITEQTDPDDKRSIRLGLTARGEKILYACYERFSKVPQLLFMDMAADDIEQCIQLLKNIDFKFSKLWLQHKTMPFDQVYDLITRKI